MSPISQVLEVDDAYFMDFSDAGGEGDAIERALIRNGAAQQFQEAILALHLTSLKLHDTDFMDVDSDPKIVLEQSVGNLTQLRCFLPR